MAKKKVAETPIEPDVEKKAPVDLESLPFFPGQKIWVVISSDKTGVSTGKVLDITTKFAKRGNENKIETYVRVRYRVKLKSSDIEYRSYRKAISKTINLTVDKAVDTLITDEDELQGEITRVEIKSLEKRIASKRKKIKDAKAAYLKQEESLKKDIEGIQAKILEKTKGVVPPKKPTRQKPKKEAQTVTLASSSRIRHIDV